MTRHPEYDHLLVLPRLQVQNANAISSPLTHGFPAITAFIGLKWALQRLLHREGLGDIRLTAVGVICHQHQELITTSGYTRTFSLTRNPVLPTGKTAAIVEEGRIHLDISLVFGVATSSLGLDPEADAALAQRILQLLGSLRIAGGSQLPPGNRTHPFWVALTGDAEGRETLFRQAMLRLLPGYALVLRDDLLSAAQTEARKHDSDATVLDAWLARSSWRHWYDENVGAWTHNRLKGSGWIVPIPVGYTALTDLQAPGSVKNARDMDTPFRFVEGLYSLGQWIGPHQFQSPEQLLWYPLTDADDGSYRCRNDYITSALPDDTFDSEELFKQTPNGEQS